jgi:hypothetical protein
MDDMPIQVQSTAIQAICGGWPPVRPGTPPGERLVAGELAAVDVQDLAGDEGG